MSSPRSKLFLYIVCNVASQRIECAFPKAAVLAKPNFDIFQRLCAERTKVDASIDRSVDQPRALQYANVPRDCRQRHGNWFGKLGDHGGLVHEAGEEGTARPVTQGAKK